MAAPPKLGYAQDMPPPGGYGPVQWERIKLRTFFSPKLTVAIWAACTTIGSIGYYFNYKLNKREAIEMRSARFAILPLLIAERDRAFLKQCRINRDEERELMKNVPEWEVGTYFGEPIYITMQDKFHTQNYYEYMAHAEFIPTMYRVLRRHFT